MTRLLATRCGCVSFRNHAGLDHEEHDDARKPGDAQWGLSPRAVAHALRWRYPRASYVFRRLRRSLETDLVAAASNEGIPLPPVGYEYLVFGTDHALVVTHDGRLLSHGDPTETVSRAGRLCAADIEKHRHDTGWRVYIMHLPTERMVARTMDYTPGGVARRYPRLRSAILTDVIPRQ